LSPDGSAVAYANREDDSAPRLLWVRRLDDARPRAIPGTEGATHPFWSPDGREIAYFAGSKVWTVATSGGRPRPLADTTYFGLGGAWGREGVIVFSGAFGQGLTRVGASGGSTEAATALDASRGETAHVWPVMLPDGKRFVFVSHTSASESNRIEMASLAGGGRQPILEADALAGYAPPWLLFVRGGALLAQRFDPDRAAVNGNARLVAQGLHLNRGLISAGTAAAGDAAAYVPYRPARVAGFWHGTDGRRLGLAFEEADVSRVRMAPDGEKLLIARFDPAQGANDLWIFDVAQGTKTRLTSTPADEMVGPFTPDGAGVLYDTDSTGKYTIERRAADDLSAPSLFLADPGGLDWSSYDVSPDGRTLVATLTRLSGSRDVWLVPVAAPEDRRPWLATEFDEVARRFSPDGAWLAVDSDRSGRPEVYLRRVSGGALVPVSPDGGQWPRFRPDGRALYFLGPDGRLYEAPLAERQGGLTPGRPRPLGLIETSGLLGYDVAPDGRILVVRRLSGGADAFHVLVGWRARVEGQEEVSDVPLRR